MSKLMKSGVMLGIIFISGLWGMIIPNGVAVEKEMGSPNFEEKVENGTQMAYMIRQQTKLRFWSNVNATLNVSCDADMIGEQEVGIEYRAENETKIRLVLEANNGSIGLRYRNQFQLENGSTYEFRYQIAMHIYRNTSDDMETTLRLRIREQDQNSTWARYNEITGEFESLPSWYENGELVANTTYYSTYVVLSGISIPDASRIWLYAIIGGFLIISIYFVYLSHKTERKKD